MTFNVEEVREAILNSSPKSKVYVGCDSKRGKKGKVRFATVVILHIDGKHGGRLFSLVEEEQYYDDPKKPKMRLLAEAYKAVGVANDIMEAVGDRDFELHLDLNTNPKHRSNLAVKEALGYVLGMLGLDAKLKPEAFAASSAGDRLVQ